jgi:hypothetical protein
MAARRPIVTRAALGQCRANPRGRSTRGFARALRLVAGGLRLPRCLVALTVDPGPGGLGLVLRVQHRAATVASQLRRSKQRRESERDLRPRRALGRKRRCVALGAVNAAIGVDSRAEHYRPAFRSILACATNDRLRDGAGDSCARVEPAGKHRPRDGIPKGQLSGSRRPPGVRGCVGPLSGSRESTTLDDDSGAPASAITAVVRDDSARGCRRRPPAPYLPFARVPTSTSSSIPRYRFICGSFRTPPAGFEPATLGLEVPPKHAGYMDLQAFTADTAGCLQPDSTIWEHVGNTAFVPSLGPGGGTRRSHG